MRHALIDKSVSDVPLHWLRTRRSARDFCFLSLAFARIGQQVKWISCAHDPGARQRERHARRVNRYPATAPLFSDGGGGAGTAGRVDHEIARIGGHEEAALDYPLRCLDYIQFVFRAARKLRIAPIVTSTSDRVVVKKAHISAMLPDVRISPAPHASALFTAPDARGEGLVRAEEGPGIADPKSADNEPAAFPLRRYAPPPPPRLRRR